LPGTLAGVAGDLIAVDLGEEVTLFRNHEAKHLFETVGIGGTVEVCDRYSLLISGEDYFSILRASEPLSPCKYDALISTTPEALARRLESHGGYTVTGREILKSIKDSNG